MISTTERDPLDVVAEEFAERCRRGETPSVTVFTTKYPDLADDLRELLPAVAQMEMLKRHRNSSLPTVMPHAPEAPGKLGDYRIVRELGRGGMGVVYEAVQESLGRRVALKLLPLPGRNDAVRRERFLREAQVAAKLHHTNIVPVFGVGEENGVPYFVMQFIPGCGLNDVIASWKNDDDTAAGPRSDALVRPNQWKRIAAIGAAAANALQYAHEQGVLHRDVKPGNLLLDHHGAIWVADFGLAKVAEHESLTATGDLLGTIAYMAPEALNGRADVRTDVYGLGMTLYELATGKMPFDQSNAAILIRMIGDKAPPAPRELNSCIPRDLETIILKAIAREPGRRYASAAELEEDLDAFRHDEPVRARRSSLVQRGTLWAKRNPILATLSSVTAGAVLFALVIGSISYARIRDSLANERTLLKDANDANANLSQAIAKLDEANTKELEANKKLAANFDLSQEALEKMFAAAGGEVFDPGGPPFNRERGGGPRNGRGGPPDGDGGPGREGRGLGGDGPRPPFNPAGGPGGDIAGILEAMLAFHEKFAEQNAANVKFQGDTTKALKFQLDAARAYRKAGQLNSFLRRTEKADAALKKSLALLDDLAKQNADSAEVVRETAMTVGMMPGIPAADPAFAGRYAMMRRAADQAKTGQPLPPGVYGKLADMATAAGDETAAREARARVGNWQPPPNGGMGGRPPGEDRRRPADVH